MRYRAYLLALVAVAAAVLAIGDGPSRPMDAHEILVAETASEMLQRHDYLVPHFNGIPRLQKPPMSYWLAALAHKTVGGGEQGLVSELEARVPSLLAGALLLLVTFELGTAAFDQRVGLLGAALLATSWGFFTYSRSARPDMVYTLFCALQMLGISIAVRRAEQGRPSLPGALLAWSAMGLALLAKGPQIPVFFLIATAAAYLTSQHRGTWRETFHPLVGLAVIALVAPYFVYLAMQKEGALALWRVQIVQDMPTPVWLRPLELYYPFTVVIGLLPWIAVLGYAAVHCWRSRRDPRVRVLLWSIFVTLVVLSFAGKLRRQYVLPILPLCAVLTAWAILELCDRASSDGRARELLRRITRAQLWLIGIAIAGVAILALGDNCTGLEMWPRAIPLLVVAAALLRKAFASMPDRVTRAWQVAFASTLVTWLAVTLSGADVSSRWATYAQFARNVRRAVPEDETLLLDSGAIEPLIYYGRRRVRPSKFDAWLAQQAARPSRDRPLFVCVDECLANGTSAEGRVIVAARNCGQSKNTVLFEPGRAQRRATVRHSCTD